MVAYSVESSVKPSTRVLKLFSMKFHESVEVKKGMATMLTDALLLTKALSAMEGSKPPDSEVKFVVSEKRMIMLSEPVSKMPVKA